MLGNDLSVQRKLTAAFIATQPVELVLTPRVRERQPTGGTKWVEQTPRPPQTLRLVEPGGYPAPVRTADGKERVVEYMLLGMPEDTIGVYDVFEAFGDRWEVVFLYHENGWETRAEVARHG